jgi:hypothetical protein
VDIVQVVQKSQRIKGFANFQDRLAATEQTTEAVRVDIVKSQELLGSFQAAIRGAQARPSPPTEGFQIQRAPLVETHYRAMRWAASIERPDAFLRSNAGRLMFSRFGHAGP